MQKKRLEEALNAGKLIALGYNLNFSKPTKLNLLYFLNCLTNQVTYDQKNSEIDVNNSNKNKNESNHDPSENSDFSDDSENNLSKEDDEFEKLEVLCLKINPNSNIVVTGDSNGDLKVYDIFSSSRITIKNIKNVTSIPRNSNNLLNVKDLNKFSSSVTYNMPIICIKWYPYSNYCTNLVYFASVNGYIGILDVNSLEKSIILEESDEISCIDFNSEGSCFASVGKDSMIRLYDSNFNNNSSFNKIIRKYGSNKESEYNELSKTDPSLISTHSNRLQAVKFNNTSNDIFYTGGWDRTVKTWDRRTSNGVVSSINGPFICGSDAIDIQENLLLTASWIKENSLELWDLRHNRKHISKISIFGNNNQDINQAKNGEYLYACKFFSTNNIKTNNQSTILACGSGTQSLHLIDYNQPFQVQNQCSSNCKSPLYCLDSVNSSNIVACGGMKKFFVFNSTSNDN